MIMIVISGCFRFAPAQRAAALSAALVIAAETRKEEGCITYGFFADVEDENSFRIFEEWQSQAHLDAHFQTAHIARFRATVAALGPLHRNVSRYVVDEVATL
ncbi:MAG: putative quinol monooxygenase [Proteobacteria bacterium]|nr:putative quinol monooxygenase [Pseudomonadota bacterium]